VAAWIGSQVPAKIALLSRTDWTDPANQDKPGYQPIASTLAKLNELETEVELVHADVADRDELAGALTRLRAWAGPLDGVFHCAGTAGDGVIMTKDLSTFQSTLRPKILGVENLDALTRMDAPFMVLYSSILSSIADAGQSDYMAANAYLDAFGAERDREGRRTRVLNWPAWRETGMAVRYGVAQARNTVGSLPTQEALGVLGRVLISDQVRVLPGRLDAEVIADRADRLKIGFSGQVAAQIAARQTASQESGQAAADDLDFGEYSPTEAKLMRIWADVLKVPDIDLYDTFAELGGQSFLAIQLYKAVNKEFAGAIQVSDIYSYPSVQQMAALIDDRRNGAK
jgi:polyketide synthase PksN